MESSISKSVSLLVLLIVLACQAIGLAEVVESLIQISEQYSAGMRTGLDPER